MKKVITLKYNLDAHKCAELVQISNRFTSNIQIEYDNKVANAKSIMSLISLVILENSTIAVNIQGNDEKNALSSMELFLLS